MLKPSLAILCCVNLFCLSDAEASARGTVTIYGLDNVSQFKVNQHSQSVNYLLQIASFHNQDNAIQFQKKIAGKTLEKVRVVTSEKATGKYYKVIIGPFSDISTFSSLREVLQPNPELQRTKKHALYINSRHNTVGERLILTSEIPTWNHKTKFTKELARDTKREAPKKQTNQNITATRQPYLTAANVSNTSTNNKNTDYSKIKINPTPVPASKLQAITTSPKEKKSSALTATQQLLEQLILKEASFNEVGVKQSLDRLDRIAPNNPEVLAAHFRLALRQGNQRLAEQFLEQLKKIAPNSTIYKHAQTILELSQPKLKAELQNARILVIGDKLAEAKKSYDLLFHGDPPTPDLTVEYWTLVSQLPGQSQTSYEHLETLYLSSPVYSIQSTDPTLLSKQASLKHVLAKILIKEGNQELHAGKLAEAKQKFQKAYDFENTNSSALIGLGDVAFDQHQFEQAKQFYQQALNIDGRIAGHYGIAAIYRQQSAQKAMDYIKTLPKDMQERMHNYVLNLEKSINNQESALLQEQAKKLESEKKWAASLIIYQKALKLTPDNVWLIYHLANVLYQSGQPQKAKELFHNLIIKQPHDLEQVYAYALYLSGIDEKKQAIRHLNTLPKKLWDTNIRELSQRLTISLILEHGQFLRDQGDKKAATAYLMQQAENTSIQLKLAEWAFLDDEFDNALSFYLKIRSREPNNEDAILGQAETYVALKQMDKARQLLQMLHQTESKSPNEQRRIANAWNSVGDKEKAETLFQHLKSVIKRGIPSQENALVFRDAARFEKLQNKPQLAREDFQEAMVSSSITSVLPKDNETYTFLTRNQEEDDWLKRSIRSDAATLYQLEDINVTVDEDYSAISGIDGFSTEDISDSITKVDFPLFNGRAFLRDDFLRISAGDFTTINGFYFDSFGTCRTLGCSTDIKQRATGDSFAGGWFNDTWYMDLGISPQGFDVVNVLGGLSYSDNFNHINWTLTGSRRPVTNSLLSFAGTRDPNTGIIWGGVVATGLDLAASYDRGGDHGFWGNLEASNVTGKNVVPNQRIRLIEGYYYKFINKFNQRGSIGLNNMIWHYQKNLNGYTLGQGGYFSPQLYLSFGIPVTYRRRTDNWSYEFGSSISWATAKLQNRYRYPIPGILPSAVLADNVIQEGGTGTGFGYSFLFLIERRLDTHLFLGAGYDYQHSTNFTPSHALIYLRYSLDGWQGDLDSPPRPLIPYSDYR